MQTLPSDAAPDDSQALALAAEAPQSGALEAPAVKKGAGMHEPGTGAPAAQNGGSAPAPADGTYVPGPVTGPPKTSAVESPGAGGQGHEAGPQQGSISRPPKAKKMSVPYYKLFSFADPLDWALMLLGTAGACLHGAALPVFFIPFGALINALGMGDVEAVPKVFLYLGYA